MAAHTWNAGTLGGRGRRVSRSKMESLATEWGQVSKEKIERGGGVVGIGMSFYVKALDSIPGTGEIVIIKEMALLYNK